MTFTSNAAFLAFFSNNVLDLGSENASLNGANLLILQFKFDLHSSSPGSGLNVGLAFGNAIVPVPEPSSSALLALGICGLLSRAAFLRIRRRCRG
jgi:hypothetical protein